MFETVICPFKSKKILLEETLNVQLRVPFQNLPTDLTSVTFTGDPERGQTNSICSYQLFDEFHIICIQGTTLRMVQLFQVAITWSEFHILLIIIIVKNFIFFQLNSGVILYTSKLAIYCTNYIRHLINVILRIPLSMFLVKEYLFFESTYSNLLFLPVGTVSYSLILLTQGFGTSSFFHLYVNSNKNDP